MIFVLSRQTVANASVLEMRSAPKRLLSLGVTVWPKGLFRTGLFWRVLFEKSLPRYVLALLPFPVLIFARPDWSLGLSQAPLAMFAFVLIVESYVLSIPSPEKRRKLATQTEIAQMGDLLLVRARRALSTIAANRGLTVGALHLVIEQSGMIRIPPLTQVSVQTDGDAPAFVDLSAQEREDLTATLFDDDLTEHDLRRVNLAENTQLRCFTFDPRDVSAHARLQARAAARSAAP
jgi:hypothetical protein